MADWNSWNRTIAQRAYDQLLADIAAERVTTVEQVVALIEAKKSK